MTIQEMTFSKLPKCLFSLYEINIYTEGDMAHHWTLLETDTKR